MTRVLLVPGVPALLPSYASLEDPVAGLREACVSAVAWLGPSPRIVATEQGARVAAALLAAGGLDTLGRGRPHGSTSGGGVLVVGSGSARRTDSSPGPFDARAVPFDDALGTALRAPDPAALRGIDAGLAEDLWAATDTFGELAGLLEAATLVGVDYDDAPYGVQYWVMRWQS
jgi:hypothetical protein